MPTRSSLLATSTPATTTPRPLDRTSPSAKRTPLCSDRSRRFTNPKPHEVKRRTHSSRPMTNSRGRKSPNHTGATLVRPRGENRTAARMHVSELFPCEQGKLRSPSRFWRSSPAAGRPVSSVAADMTRTRVPPRTRRQGRPRARPPSLVDQPSTRNAPPSRRTGRAPRSSTR